MPPTLLPGLTHPASYRQYVRMPDQDVHEGATAAGAGALAAEYAERLLLGTVRDVHRAVSSRVFRLTGPAAEPVRTVHDGISDGVYGLLGSALRSGGAGLRR